VTTDTESPPGAWKTEMERMPWRYKDQMVYSQQMMVEASFANMRKAGLNVEADVLALEIKTLKNEIEDLRKDK
jgi:hypothetical protein